MYFKPYGGVRWAQSGILGPDSDSATRRSYTGQYEETSQWMGSLMHYKARYYSPFLHRFTQPDTIVPEPGNPQALNRFSYVLNRPTSLSDPSGHWVWIAVGAVLGGIAGGAAYAFYATTTGQEIDGGYMALAVVGGAAAGALIATGVTWVAGVSAAQATTAAVTGAGAANAACGGDMCESEVKQLCGGDCSDELAGAGNAAAQAASQVKNVIEAASKSQAREMVRAGIDSLSSAQSQRALDIIRSGNSQSTYGLNMGPGNIAEMIVRVPGQTQGFFAETSTDSGKMVSCSP